MLMQFFFCLEQLKIYRLTYRLGYSIFHLYDLMTFQ